MPTDVNLQKRGIHLASTCSLCYAAEESSNHLFFECSFATSLWNWLGNLIGSPLDSSSIQSLLMHCRNQRRFEDTTIRFMQACDKIKRETALAGNHSTLAAKPSLFEFTIIRSFQVTPHYIPTPVIAEVRWLPPPPGWVKVNSDGAAHDFLGHAGGGDIFRDNKGDMLGYFSTYLNIQDSLYAELYTAIMAIQIANLKGLKDV
ncbi:PREDICTED: uncharacterized protein LOC109342482 [Lupinus angustifolius]|uniref:uncharacterized protein LOC109342482 n=1 Tax=Lupinus angustifolius TaxID=3871 RepID=UPI00092E5601|nr:PREDICTED: uncharacterized protein LOC109342482 [Lupinus angustifolius]